jgi:hypothetical protein
MCDKVNINNLATKQILLDHLVSQYRLYREEIRMYLGYAAASVSILIFLFIGEINASKESPRLILLIPLTTLSYTALLGCFYSYSWIAAHYSELLELKINKLLGSSEYVFENYYVGPKPHRGEEVPFRGLWLLIMAMPVAFTGYGMMRLFHDPKIPAWLFHGVWIVLILSLVFISWALYRIVHMRKRMNTEIFAAWQNRIEKHLIGHQIDTATTKKQENA